MRGVLGHKLTHVGCEGFWATNLFMFCAKGFGPQTFQVNALLYVFEHFVIQMCVLLYVLIKLHSIFQVNVLLYMFEQFVIQM